MTLTRERRAELMAIAAKPVPKTQIELIHANAIVADVARLALPAYERELVRLESELDKLNDKYFDLAMMLE